MTDIKIVRVNKGKYKLKIDGDVISEYTQEVMNHPWDWADDAQNGGATLTSIRSRDYEFKDER